MKKVVFLIFILIFTGCIIKQNNKEELCIYGENDVLGYEYLIKDTNRSEIVFNKKLYYLTKQEGRDLKVLIASNEGFFAGEILFIIEKDKEIIEKNKIIREKNSTKKNSELELISQIYISDVKLDNINDEVEIKVKARKLFNVSSLNLNFLCDQYGEYVNAESNLDIVENSILNCERNKIIFAYSGKKRDFYDDILFTVKFKITDEGKSILDMGRYEKFFKLDNIKFQQDNQIKNFNYIYYPLKINQFLTKNPLGDYNKDGKINLSDFELLKYYYGSTEEDIVEKYDVASDNKGIAYMGEEGSLKKLYTGKIKDGVIGLAELIVLVNNMQIWNFLNVENELYLELETEKQIINIGETFQVKLLIKKLYDDTKVDFNSQLIEKLKLYRYYNGIKLEKDIEIDDMDTLQILMLDKGYYILEIFPQNGSMSKIDFEVIEYISEDKLRLKAEKNGEDVYELGSVEIIGDGEDSIRLLIEKIEDGEYMELVNDSIVYKYRYNNEEKEYILNSDIFYTKYDGQYSIWGEYNNGINIVKTQEIKINVLPGIKSVRIFVKKKMLMLMKR